MATYHKHLLTVARDAVLLEAVQSNFLILKREWQYCRNQQGRENIFHKHSDNHGPSYA